jgi:hypothetical protein
MKDDKSQPLQKQVKEFKPQATALKLTDDEISLLVATMVTRTFAENKVIWSDATHQWFDEQRKESGKPHRPIPPSPPPCPEAALKDLKEFLDEFWRDPCPDKDTIGRP